MKTKKAKHIKGKKVETGIWRSLKDGKAVYFVEVSVRISNGKIKRPCRQGYAPNLVQARDLKRRFVNELTELKIAGPKVSFADFLADYYRHIETKKRASSVVREKSSINAHLLPTFKAKTLDQISQADCETFLAGIRSKFSSQYTRHFENYMSGIFKLAIKRNLVSRNPIDGIEKEKVVHKDPLVLNQEQVEKLLGYLHYHEPVMYYYVLVSVMTFARAGEVRALTWSDVDCIGKKISISKTIDVKTGLKPFPKNGQSRKVWINDQLMKCLTELKDKYPSAPTDPLLPHWREFASGEQGKPLKIVCRSLEIPEIRYHDLRATGITLCLVQGVPLAIVMSLAGHKRISSTQKYLRISAKDVEGGTDCLKFNFKQMNGATTC